MFKSSETNALNKFDVIEFAKSIINEVESVRSYVRSVDDTTKQEFNIPIESRVNAFFRLVGLPMFVTMEPKDDNQKGSQVAGENYLNSGFFGPKFDEYTIKNSDYDDIDKKLVTRETIFNKRENEIGTDKMNQNMSKALRSSMPIITNTKGEQEIGIPAFKRKVFKQLFPLVTSYIDVFPKRNEIARPFVTNENLQQITNSTPLKIPFIETVARIRLVSCDNANDSKGENKASEVAKSIETNIGNENYKKLSSNSENVFDSLSGSGLLEKFIILKLLDSIYQLANTWTRLQTSQELLYKKIPYTILIKTTSSKASIFGKRAAVSADIQYNEKSEYSKKLKWLNENIAKEEAFQTLLPSNDVIKQVNSKTASNRSTSFASLVGSFSQLLNYNLEQLKKQEKSLNTEIQRRVQEAEKLRVRLEMMTGEFTGLSIVDVVAVITGLFILKKEHLVALLDKFVIDDMKKDDTLKSAVEKYGVPDFGAATLAVKELEDIVTFIFNLFNFYAESIKDKNKNPGKATKNNRQSRRNLEDTTTMSAEQSDGDE